MTTITEAITHISDGVANMEGWFTDLKPHLETAAAEAARIQGRPVVQALEAAALTPAEEAMVAEIIGKLPGLRGAQDAPAATEAPAQADVPADVPSPADVAVEPAAQPA